VRLRPDQMKVTPPGSPGGPPTPTPETEVLRAGPSAWEAGARFSDYEIDSLLASGGMAEIWRAKIKGMEGFEKRIVIKTMLTHYQNRPDLVDMFISEASLAARLSHPNVVDVIDFGQLEGRYFIAMEYVPGMSLRFAQKRVRAQGRRLPMAAVLHVARDVCEALQYMHDLEDVNGEMGLVHRDLSPDNIILSTSGATKLIDFGTARATARTPPSPAFVGKFRYAAPERIRQQGEDNRSDIYSLGVILYECLTGVRPFEGSDADVIRLVTTSVACDPSVGAADVPASVAEVVKKATAADPARRFASAQAMGTALARCLVELGATNKEREVTGALATLLDESSHPPFERSLGTAPAREAVPHPVGAPESSGSDGIAIAELEIIEASGPIRDVVEVGSAFDGYQPIEPIPAADTERISITLPPDAFPTPGLESIREPAAEASGLPEWRRPPKLAQKGSQKRTYETTHSEWAVAIFDQGLEMRLEGRYEEALEAWELALRLAPDNHLYQAQVNKLRAQLQSRRRGR
jgi:serine/threonine protein kinase